MHDIRSELFAQLPQLSEVEVLQVHRKVDSVLQSTTQQAMTSTFVPCLLTQRALAQCCIAREVFGGQMSTRRGVGGALPAQRSMSSELTLSQLGSGRGSALITCLACAGLAVL